jgi:lipopolysaccharide export system protein LptA
MKHLLFLCLLFLAVDVTRAQPVPAAASTPVETVITSQKANIWSNEAGTESYGIFTGNVVITGTNLRITCDRLDVTAEGQNAPKASDSGGKAGTANNVEKFKTIVAQGRVQIIQGDREANCERAEVLPGEGKIILSGQPVVMDRGNDSVVTGEPLILLKNERRVHGDNVKITFPPINTDLGFDKNAPAPTSDAAKP